jgi:hypothetical protein
MPDNLSAQAEEASPGGTNATAYVPPRLTRVGNVRELLAGVTGTVPDTDPGAIDNQSSPG